MKKKKTDSNLHKRKESCVKTIYVHVQQQQNCLYKHDLCIFKSFLMATARKSFVFVSQIRKKELTIFWHQDFLDRCKKLYHEK